MTYAVRSALILAAIGLGACSTPTLSDMPPTSAPRITVSLARLEATKTSQSRYVAGWASDHAPFWEPSAEEVLKAELAVWHRLRWHGRQKSFRDSLVQFAGVSLGGQPRILVQSFCPWMQEIEQRYNPTFEDLVFPGDHTCTCYVAAYFDPGSEAVSNVATEGVCQR